jgi:hypothetical protein
MDKLLFAVSSVPVPGFNFIFGRAAAQEGDIYYHGPITTVVKSGKGFHMRYYMNRDDLENIRIERFSHSRFRPLASN